MMQTGSYRGPLQLDVHLRMPIRTRWNSPSRPSSPILCGEQVSVLLGVIFATRADRHGQVP